MEKKFNLIGFFWELYYKIKYKITDIIQNFEGNNKILERCKRYAKIINNIDKELNEFEKRKLSPDAKELIKRIDEIIG